VTPQDIALIISQLLIPATAKHQVALHFAEAIKMRSPLFDKERFLKVAYPEIFAGS
jgi:hypothetical protein